MLTFLLLVSTAPFLGTSAMGGGVRDARPRSQQTGASSKDVIPGVVVVKLRHSHSMSKATTVQAFAQCGVTSLAPAFPMTSHLSDAELVAGKVDLSWISFGTIPTTMDPVEVAAQLATLPEVEYAEPKYYSYLCDVPNDSDYGVWQQRYFDLMNVAEGWSLQKGSPGVVIAAVDGGTNWQHEDLTANLWINPAEDINHNGRFDPGPPPQGDDDGIDQDGNGKVDDVIGWNFTFNTNNPRGSQSTPGSADHGTETASGFGAVTNNGHGMAGTSWNCRLMPVCAAADDSTFDLRILYGFEGIEYASRTGARVINCSWGHGDGFSQWEQDVITAATQRGALIVAAAGNNHLQNLDDSPYYPASYDHVLSVGATNASSDEITNFTNIGLSVGTFAPGVAIRVAKDNGSYGTDQGTSHSTPLVAGLAGLLFAAHPDWTPEQVAEQIRMTSDPIDIENPTYAGSLGHGRVNFQRALSEVHSGVVVVAGRFHTPSERTFFLEGDTVILSVKVKNIMPLAAENLSFNSTADPVLPALAPIHGPTRLDPGAEDSLTCAFQVGALWFKQDVKVRLEWSANSSDCDAHMFKTTLYMLYIWTKDARNPVFTGVRGTWSAYVFNPCVLFNPDSARYEMWFNACPGPTSDNSWRPYSIGRAVSSDGITWSMYPSPVLSPDPGTWDSFTTDAPEVLRENGQYKMWYSSYNNNLPSKPGYLGSATSPDGIHWTKYPGNPIFGPGTADWEVAGPVCCCVVPKPGGYRMWYDGYNLSLTMAKIGYAESSDGINWIRDTVNNPVLGGGGPGQWDDPIVFQPNVVGIGDSSYMWYVGSRTGFGGWTGLAVSKDGRTNWTRCPSNPVLVGTPGTWDAERTCVGAVLLVGDTLHMWYDGWRMPDPSYQYSIGHAWSKVTVPSTSVRGGKEELPRHFMLAQNFPNPFNPSTNIQYALPHRSHVTLTIFNTLGQKVVTLVNGEIEAGSHSVQFDGSGLASGVYFYRLQAGSYVDTKKLLLVK